MRSHIAVLALVLLTGCHERHELVPVSKCGQECYFSGGKPGLGPCRAGHWFCPDDKDESTATCEGQIGPSWEQCNGIDDDCNGKVDDLIDLTMSCSSACGPGSALCEHGAWHCYAPQPKAEVCNGKDDDCDGKIDEPEDLPLPAPCYDAGSPDTLRYGPCRQGKTMCMFGAYQCVDQVGPKPETCNNVDDDCNGQVDDGLGNSKPVDIVFLVDCSGSMGSTIGAVQAAVQAFSGTYVGRPDIRWALVGVPDTDPSHDATVTLLKDFTDPVTFAAALQTLNANGGGMEPTLDAVYELTAGNPLGVHWTPNSRHVLVMFTDEDPGGDPGPTSYLTPPITYADTSASLVASNTTLYLFTTQGEQPIWSNVGPPSNLQMEPLTQFASVMEMALTQIIMEATCH